MTLMLDLVADTRRMVYGSMADQLNFLSAEALAGAVGGASVLGPYVAVGGGGGNENSGGGSGGSGCAMIRWKV